MSTQLGSPVNSTSIYQTLLGADYERLGPILRHVHGPETPIQASGKVTVTHGKSLMVRLTNRMMGIPRPGENVALQLHIERDATHETWIRTFGTTPLITRQWAENGLFIEAVGATKMAMRLRIVDGILHFEPVYTKVLGIKVPKALGVSVLAKVEEVQNGWKILVETKSALLGLLFRYDGMIQLAQ